MVGFSVKNTDTVDRGASGCTRAGGTFLLLPAHQPFCDDNPPAGSGYLRRSTGFVGRVVLFPHPEDLHVDAWMADLEVKIFPEVVVGQGTNLEVTADPLLDQVEPATIDGIKGPSIG